MKRAILWCTCLGLAMPTLSWAQHDHPTPHVMTTKMIGTVDFQTSCQPTVREDFNRAVALLHSFWFAQSRTMFEEVLKRDATCAIASWGIALTHWGNPFGGLRAPQTIAAGKAAIDKGLTIGSPTPREKGYIEAVAGLFSSPDVTTQRARVVAYEEATAKVAAQNPNDAEARIFWALAIAQTALPTDKTYGQNLRAAGILEPMYEKMPNHPGLAHYIIHSYDVPALAAKGLSAARAYADIAPVVPHALHMPSHTFTRVGAWKESVATNKRSAAEAEKVGGAGDALHAMDYEGYAYLQMGMDAQAKGVLDHAMKVATMTNTTGGAGGAGPNTFAMAAIPARYVMERQQWADAAQLEPRPAPNTPYTEAITHFARAVGAARSGTPGAAAADIARLKALVEREKDMKDAYWAEIVDIQRRGAEAWVMFAEGKRDEGISAMMAAADAEDKTDKAAVTPGPLAPAREMLGYMLIETGRHHDALAAFEAVMKKEPNRFLALWGGAQAAEKLKQTAKAKGYYQQIVNICKDAGNERPELAHARKMAGPARRTGR